MFYIISFFIFVFGLIIGSFLNCFIWRLHKNESLWNRSYCPKCSKMIAWFDNIPVFSFLALRGRCRNCKKAISLQYPVVEMITGILFYLLFRYNFPDIEFLLMNDFEQILPNFLFLIRDWFMLSVLIIIFIYDLKWYLILDKITFPAIAIVLIFNLILGFSLMNLLLAGFIGAGFFLIQFLVSNGKWIGGGDVRLGFLMGVFFGRLDYLAVAIMIAYFLGSAVGIGLISFGKKKWGSKLPLGTFLTIATVLVMLWAEPIISWYLGLF